MHFGLTYLTRVLVTRLPDDKIKIYWTGCVLEPGSAEETDAID